MPGSVASATTVAIDVGGTFTDLASRSSDGERIVYSKASTTPDEFSAGVLEVLASSRVVPETIDPFVFACTIFINALLQGTGARTALVTTMGFRDVLEIGRGNRRDMYNFMYQKPPCPIPRQLRYEVVERMDHAGRPLIDLDVADVERVARKLKGEQIESVAVMFINSYANPDHETRCGEVLRGVMGTDVDVVLSSNVTRLWLEYERAMSTAINARLAPVARHTFKQLEEGLDRIGAKGARRAMKSNGGATSFDRATKVPIYLMDSGPAGGVIGAAALGSVAGVADLITFDVGGTTAKCSLIEGGRLTYTLDYKVDHDRFHAGYPIRTPSVDIVEIGAGGGSIAWTDAASSLHLGPISAGASPGPACYGLGGTDPTLTDACLLTGRIDSRNFLGGAMNVSRDLAQGAFEHLAIALGCSPEEAILGVIELAQAKMAHAVKLVSIDRGRDPRDFSLMAYGGGGPMYAASLAKELQIPRVIVPPNPGTFSALGMLLAELREDEVLTEIHPLRELTSASLRARFEKLKATALTNLADVGGDAASAHFEASLDMRYQGQEHTVSVLVELEDCDVLYLRSEFERLHKVLYTFTAEDEIECVHFRLVALIPTEVGFGEVFQVANPPKDMPSPLARPLLLDTGWTEAGVATRSELPIGESLDGPVIIEESSSSTVVYPGQRVWRDATDSLVIQTGS